MSDVEFHAGKLQKHDISICDSVEQWCQLMCETQKLDKPEWCHTWKEAFFNEDENSKNWFIHNETVYKILDHYKTEDSEYYMRLYDNPDGTISFVGSFYNGGTCFDEMLTESLDEKFENNE